MKTFWTRKAVLSLDAVLAEIASEQPSAAKRIGKKILSTADVLGMWPLAGRDLRLKHCRYFPVPGTKYIVLYKVYSEHISILHIVHGATDWRNRPM